MKITAYFPYLSTIDYHYFLSWVVNTISFLLDASVKRVCRLL